MKIPYSFAWKSVIVRALFASLSCSNALAADFSLSSPTLRDGASLPLEHRAPECGGKGISPALAWRNAPPGTRSLVVMMYDLDSPENKRGLLWWLLNIPPAVSSLPANAGDPARDLAPKGSEQVVADRALARAGYLGACPPKGEKPHRYEFSVIALDVARLEVLSSNMLASTAMQMRSHEIARASLQVSFGR